MPNPGAMFGTPSTDPEVVIFPLLAIRDQQRARRFEHRFESGIIGSARRDRLDQGDRSRDAANGCSDNGRDNDSPGDLTGAVPTRPTEFKL